MGDFMIWQAIQMALIGMVGVYLFLILLIGVIRLTAYFLSDDHQEDEIALAVFLTRFGNLKRNGK